MTTNTDPTADEAPVRTPRPNTVRYSLYALAARGVCSVLASLSLYGARGEVRTRLAEVNKSKGWTNADLNHNVDLLLRSSLLNAGFVIILLALAAKFVWDGRSWGRWIYLAVIVLLAQDENAVLGLFSYHHLLPRILTGLTGIFGLASLVLLFLPASNAYFRPVGGSARPGLFGALAQSRASSAGRTRPAPAVTGGPEVSLTKGSRARRPSATGQAASPAAARSTPSAEPSTAPVQSGAPARSGGPRSKSRQAPPKRPGGR